VRRHRALPPDGVRLPRGPEAVTVTMMIIIMMTMMMIIVILISSKTIKNKKVILISSDNSSNGEAVSHLAPLLPGYLVRLSGFHAASHSVARQVSFTIAVLDRATA